MLIDEILRLPTRKTIFPSSLVVTSVTSDRHSPLFVNIFLEWRAAEANEAKEPRHRVATYAQRNEEKPRRWACTRQGSVRRRRREGQETWWDVAMGVIRLSFLNVHQPLHRSRSFSSIANRFSVRKYLSNVYVSMHLPTVNWNNNDLTNEWCEGTYPWNDGDDGGQLTRPFSFLFVLYTRCQRLASSVSRTDTEGISVTLAD